MTNIKFFVETIFSVRRLELIALLFCAGSIASCGGGGGDSSGSPASTIIYQATSAGLFISDAATNVKIEVPSGATLTSFNLTISKSAPKSTIVELVNGTNLPTAGNQFVIESSAPEKLNKATKITIPYDKNIAQDENKLGVAYYSSAINKYVPVEISNVDKINGAITFYTNHFSIWIPIYGLYSPSSNLSSVATDFTPENDGFPFKNSLTSPYDILSLSSGKKINGNCVGMSTLAVGYYFYKKNNKSGAGLNQYLNEYTNNCNSNKNNESLCQGIYKASAILNSTVDDYINAAGGRKLIPLSDNTAARSIYLALTQYGNTPTTLGIADGVRDSGHSVVVYKYIANNDGSGIFYYYDPNLPDDRNRYFIHNADGTIVPFKYEGGTNLVAGYIFASPFLGGGITPDDIIKIFENYFPKTAPSLPAGYVFQGGLTWMPVTTRLNFSAANSYCKGTAINGQTGWRMPTKSELLSLYSSGFMNGQNWILQGVWSSTEPTQAELAYLYSLGIPNGSSIHYSVDLSSGSVIWNSDGFDPLVSCVR